MDQFSEQYEDIIRGTLSCFDRIIIQGNLPGACFAGGMTSILYAEGIPIFDYKKFAEDLRNKVRDHVSEIAKDNDLKIQFVNSKIRKEKVIADILKHRGTEPGLVHILSLRVLSGLSAMAQQEHSPDLLETQERDMPPLLLLPY